MSTDVDAPKISRRGKRIWFVVTTFFAVATGVSSVYYPVTTYIYRGLRSLAKWLGEEGTARTKDCLRDILLNAGPKG